jgi:hypothetical protein
MAGALKPGLLCMMSATGCGNVPDAVVAADCEQDSVVTSGVHIPASMTNVADVRQRFEQIYSETFQGRGDNLPRRVLLAVYLNEHGAVYKSVVQQSSGSQTHDGLGVEISRFFTFTPAYIESSPVCTRLELPVTFPPERG